MAALADTLTAKAADIPSVDKLLREPCLAPLAQRHGREPLTAALRAHLEHLRRQALNATLLRAALDPNVMALALEQELHAAQEPRLRAVFNLTGTVLHTNLGRALLPDEAVRAVVTALTSPVNLEFDLTSGGRGERDAHIEGLLRELTGAEAATVVNNNAAAVLLMLSVLAARREVIVSRGELVEIGGSFRIPDIMRQAGARLIEVGTTNRTHLSDYAEAIGPRTALIMKVHASNYAISGFTKSIAVEQLAPLARTHDVPLAVDLGSGTLLDLTRWQLPAEPTVRDTLLAGADLVSFSGDKLLGGPQAGILVGGAALIGRMRKSPLKRALRVGKLTLAALEAVLALYRAPESLAQRLTTLRLLTRDPLSIKAQAERLHGLVQRALGEEYAVATAPMQSQVGSGALPVSVLTSHGLVVRPGRGSPRTLTRLDAVLRALPRPVIGRLADKALWLDLRCLEVGDEPLFAAQWSQLPAPQGWPR